MYERTKVRWKDVVDEYVSDVVNVIKCTDTSKEKKIREDIMNHSVGQ